jgi:hypothetical protein
MMMMMMMMMMITTKTTTTGHVYDWDPNWGVGERNKCVQ